MDSQPLLGGLPTGSNATFRSPQRFAVVLWAALTLGFVVLSAILGASVSLLVPLEIAYIVGWILSLGLFAVSPTVARVVVNRVTHRYAARRRDPVSIVEMGA